MTNKPQSRIQEFIHGQGGWTGAIIFILMWTIFLPVTLLLRLIVFGSFTDRETWVDKIRDRIVGN